MFDIDTPQLEVRPLDTWKVRLLDLPLEVPESDEFGTIESLYKDEYLIELTTTCLHEMEFFCSLDVITTIAGKLSRRQTRRKISLVRIRAACQVFALLLARFNHEDGRVRHIYDWLDVLTASAVFDTALAWACSMITHAGATTKYFDEYLRHLSFLFDISYPSSVGIFGCVSLSDLEQPKPSSTLVSLRTVETWRVSCQMFAVALMLNIDNDDMYKYISYGLVHDQVRITDPDIQDVLNANLPFGFSFVFDEFGYLLSP